MTTKPVAGARIRAANAPAPYLVSAAASSTLTVTSATIADIPGATLSITTVNNNASVLVIGVFDITVNTPATVACIGYCNVDGSQQSGEAVVNIVTTNQRGPGVQVWNVTLASPTSHVIKLQGSLNGASGSATFNTTHTTITATVFDW